MRSFLVLLLIALPALCQAQEPQPWVPVNGIPQEESFLVLAVAADDPDVIAAATSGQIHVSEDSGRTWGARRLLPAKSGVLAIAIQSKPRALLLATDQGLYAAADAEGAWRRVFNGVGPDAGVCTFITFLSGTTNRALLGTRNGLFLSEDVGASWRELAVPIDAREIIHAAVDRTGSDRATIVSRTGCFTGHLKTGEWRQVLSARHAEEMAGEGSENKVAGEEEDTLPVLRAVALDPSDASTMLVGSNRGALISTDAGASWLAMPRAGLGSASITRLLAVRRSALGVYAATAGGVFHLPPKTDAWQPMAEGLTGAVSDFAITPHGLLAATENGLLFSPAAAKAPGWARPASAEDIPADFPDEPGIGQVRDAAIRYAEVHPDKIRRWRRQASLKALLPSVSVGYDRDSSHDAHYDEGSFPAFQVIGTSDRSHGVDFSVSWDLSDLIWSTDQTSIDTRSKLMVELRNDIVDEVTRVYFERRRLQLALLTAPPADPKALLEKKLRVDELAALLDGMTGGYFTQHIPSPQTQ